MKYTITSYSGRVYAKGDSDRYSAINAGRAMADDRREDLFLIFEDGSEVFIDPIAIESCTVEGRILP